MENTFKTQEKIEEAIGFSIDYILNDLYKFNVNIMEQLNEKTNLRYKTDFNSFSRTCNLGLSFCLSYIFTPEEDLKKERVENLGHNLSNEGLAKQDEIYWKCLNYAFEKGYDKKLDLIKNHPVTFDYSVKDFKNILEISVRRFFEKHLHQMSKIKKDYFEFSVMCPKCYKCEIPQSEEMCNSCKKK